ncbi:MAG TPA: helix-turn-helix transcriptional regulator [Anaerolineae bacterium]|nr:helix-turn-helix transcriptional regulator [Anaerolineae bacterium]
MTFTDWLVREMANKGWGNNELARRMGLSNSVVSLVLVGRQNPGVEFCQGVARALKIPPEDVLRCAGILPAVAVDRAAEAELLRYFRPLPADVQRLVLIVAQALYRAAGAVSNQKIILPKGRRFSQKENLPNSKTGLLCEG